MAHKLITADASLLFEVERLKDGANTHRFNNLVGVYIGYVDLANDKGKSFLPQLHRVEEDLRNFVQQQRSLFYRTRLSY
jgi:hypothetical protein